MLVIRAGIHKMHVRIAYREDPDKKQSDLGLHCLPMPFETSFRNFRSFTVRAATFTHFW